MEAMPAKRRSVVISGAGVDTTFLQLRIDETAENAAGRHYFAVGAATTALVDAFRLCDLTIDCQLPDDKAVACGEIWQAADQHEFPVSLEERLRGGDRKIETCLLVETLRVPDAERVAASMAGAFGGAEISVYRVLCDIRAGD